MTFRVLRQAAIEAQLAASGSLWLAGRSQALQTLAPIATAAIDFGMTESIHAGVVDARSFPGADGYHYVSKGMVECRDIDTGLVHRFFAGDFFVISLGTRYLMRMKQDTRFFFARCPGGVAGLAEAMDAESDAWAQEPLRADRLDHAGADGPAANSMIPGAAAAVIDERHRLLMVQRRDSGRWTMPGGAMEIGDSLASCVRREVAEETAVAVEVLSLIGTYSDPEARVAYSDGEVRREFSILFHCRPTGGTLKINDESIDGRWVGLNEVLDLPMVATQRRRIEDVINFVQTGAVSIR